MGCSLGLENLAIHSAFCVFGAPDTVGGERGLEDAWERTLGLKVQK